MGTRTNASFTIPTFSLVKSLPPTQLQHLRFFIFCLGDRAYGDQFCAAGRKLIVRLRQLGAQMVNAPGYGDDGSSGGVLADLDEWMTTQLRPVFGTAVANKEMVAPEESCVAPYQITLVDNAPTLDDVDESLLEFIQHQAPLTANTPCLAGLVVDNTRLTASDWHQDTRHIRIQVTVPYHSGDVTSIMPLNAQEHVERFLQVLPSKLRQLADRMMQVTHQPNSTMHPGVCYEHWPKLCTLRQWLTSCADFGALPEREDLRALSRFCCPKHEMGEEHRNRLLHLSDPKGAALYNDYILREKRSWVDVFYDFDSLGGDCSSLTISDLFGLLSPIRPRDFSIASAPSISSCEYLELCVAVVEGSTRLRRKFRGLCSSYLASTTRGSNIVRLWVRRGTFPVTNSESPVICIASGTGVAPMRSLLQERLQKSICNSCLVFGCRRAITDYYYKEEWTEFGKKSNFEVFNAFSQEEVGRKTYVQDVLDHVDSLASILMSKGYIFIAGNPRMARCVKDKLIDILVKESDGDRRAAKTLFGRLQKSGHVSIEAWG